MSDHAMSLSATDLEWRTEISEARVVIERLLATKKRTRRLSPDVEQILWSRHFGELATLKQMMDAVAL